MTGKFITLLILMLALAAFTACGDEQPGSPQALETIAVKALKIEPTLSRTGQSYAGTVEALDKVRLSTRVSGWVEQIRVAEGDRVRKGDLLVELRSGDLKAKRAQAEASIREAEAHFANAEKNLKRIESLYAQKAATQKELDDMRAMFASATARRDAAHQMKKEVEEYLRYANLRAPFDGIVTRKFVEAGDLANPGQPILEVENISRVKIVAKVPESEISNLTPGMPVAVSIGSLDAAANFAGTVDQIVPAADPMSRQFEIKVLVDNPREQIKSGMFARITLQKEGAATLLIPRDALFRRGQLEGVYVINDAQQATLRWVRSGARIDGQVEILSGLNSGEMLVLSNLANLLDGQPVEVR